LIAGLTIACQNNHLFSIQSFYLPLLRKIWPVVTLYINNIYIEGPGTFAYRGSTGAASAGVRKAEEVSGR
jgi:hypothetical protein